MRKIDEVGSLELIFVFAPCRAGKNVENIRDGFGHPSRGATSRVILKYGSYDCRKNNVKTVSAIASGIEVIYNKKISLYREVTRSTTEK